MRCLGCGGQGVGEGGLAAGPVESASSAKVRSRTHILGGSLKWATRSARHCRKSILDLGQLCAGQTALLESEWESHRRDVGILGQWSGVTLDDLRSALPGLGVYGSGFVCFFPPKSLKTH